MTGFSDYDRWKTTNPADAESCPCGARHYSQCGRDHYGFSCEGYDDCDDGPPFPNEDDYGARDLGDLDEIPSLLWCWP